MTYCKQGNRTEVFEDSFQHANAIVKKKHAATFI